MVTPLVAIMKDQVEQLQSMGILALVIGVDIEEDEEEVLGKSGSARLFMKVLKACCQRNGEKNNNKHIVAITIDEDDEGHSVTE